LSEEDTSVSDDTLSDDEDSFTVSLDELERSTEEEDFPFFDELESSTLNHRPPIH
jgi:hypothetical protein